LNRRSKNIPLGSAETTPARAASSEIDRTLPDINPLLTILAGLHEGKLAAAIEALPANGAEPSPLVGMAAKSVEDNVTLLRHNDGFCRAMEILEGYQTDPALREVFGLLLPLLACLAVPRRGGGTKKAFEGIWSSKTGKTWKALKEFPSRLRNVAVEVERINNSEFLSPALWIRGDETGARLLKGHCGRLPGVLRFYAGAMDKILTELVPALFKRHLPPDRRGHSSSLFGLSNLVKAMTGRFHDEEVCDLLDATALALGVNRKRQFNPVLLAQARSRLASKRSTT
jgi:hypothetical protein